MLLADEEGVRKKLQTESTTIDKQNREFVFIYWSGFTDGIEKSGFKELKLILFPLI